MAQLDEELEARMMQGVELLREHRSPPAAAQERVLAALEAGLGSPPNGDPGGKDEPDGGLELGGSGGPEDGAKLGEAPIAGTSSIGYAAKVVGATLALTTAGLLTLRAGALTLRALADDDEPKAVAADEPEPSPQPERPRSDEPARGQAPPEGSAREPHAPTGGEAQEPAPTREPPPPVPSASERGSADIEAELARLEAARAAGTPAQAITELQAHAREFPEGTLTDERELLWVLADCERGELDQAEARARRFVAARPRSPLVDRMLDGCPGLQDRLAD